MVGAIWVTAWTLGVEPRMLALALFGTHCATVQIAGSVKPYGLGSVFIVLAFGAIGRLTISPRRRQLLYAFGVSILAVQTLYHNATLILAACLAGVVVAAVVRERPVGRAVMATGAAAAVSLLSYAVVVRSSRAWTALMLVDSD